MPLHLDPILVEGLSRAVCDEEPVTGLTHEFYRYPARFSPQFARAAIEAFTKPGDLVFDPFVGSGTTLVEAAALGRKAIGTDISSLATFLVRVKTTPLTEQGIAELRHWSRSLPKFWNLRRESTRPRSWVTQEYQRNLHDRSTWRMRKVIELILGCIPCLSNLTLQDFARCVLLKTSQWALDCRSQVPAVGEFRERFLDNLEEMVMGMREYGDLLNHLRSIRGRRPRLPICLHRSAIGIENNGLLARKSPRLVLTSPPYPGIHVLYHRWQVFGRRETPAPFWIANSLDGNGAAYYTFGDRRQQGLTRYYTQVAAAFRSIAKIADRNTLIVQAMAFSDPSWQLERYLKTMQSCGFVELQLNIPNSADGRLWRSVPNRKWYANFKGASGGSREVILFHRISSKGRQSIDFT